MSRSQYPVERRAKRREDSENQNFSSENQNSPVMIEQNTGANAANYGADHVAVAIENSRFGTRQIQFTGDRDQQKTEQKIIERIEYVSRQ